MRRILVLLVLCLVCFVLGAGVMLFNSRRGHEPRLPDPPALVTQMREVARLETLDVALYKKVSFEPDPKAGKSMWGDLIEWAKYEINQPKGRAIIFADVHLGIDFSKLDTNSLNISGTTIDVVLPPITAQVELKPGETEVVGSNLDSAQTAQLFDLAKRAFEAEVRADPKLNAKARASAERSLRALLITVGFREVRFVATLPAAGNSL
jgi:hypothetical protein